MRLNPKAPIFVALCIITGAATAHAELKGSAQVDVGQEPTIKSFNVYINPLDPLAGAIISTLYLSGGADWAPIQYVSFGPVFSYFNSSSSLLFGTPYSGWSAGARANIYPFGGVKGLYIAPSVEYKSISPGSTSVIIPAVVANFIVGYRALWDSGFNMRFGGGVAFVSTGGATYTVGTTTTTSSPSSGIVPSLEFQMGWAF